MTDVRDFHVNMGQYATTKKLQAVLLTTKFNTSATKHQHPGNHSQLDLYFKCAI